MSGVFLFLMRPGGDPVTEEIRQRFDASAVRNELPLLRWMSEGNYAVALGPDVTGLGTGPVPARTRRLVVVGNARLDNREEVAGWARAPELLAGATDLEVIAEAIEVRGGRCIPSILGDFGFVVWNPLTRELTAARDAFGVKTLYYAEQSDLFALSSRAAVLAEREEYDREYIIDYLIGAFPSLQRTVFAEVRSVPPGATLTWQRGSQRTRRYWSAHDFSIDPSLNGEEQIEVFRDLLVRAVTNRLTGRSDTWAQLSGGLDSSSVVSVAQTLEESKTVPAGVAGTVTLADSLGDGNESEYVAAILERYPVRNEQVADYWMWQPDGFNPPLTDRPYAAYPFFARDCRMRDIVLTGGGRVLLSGEGADHYLTGSLYYVADWISKGQLSKAIREITRWSGILKTSFWRLAFQYAFMPLLPPPAHRLMAWDSQIPAWLIAAGPGRGSLINRMPNPRKLATPAGSKYVGQIAYSVANVASAARADILETSLEMRYPFLYRPLVEFSLRLPHGMRSRPHARKWILRQAVHGVVPERVRMRIGKGRIGGRVAWSLLHERKRIDAMLRDAIIGQLGFVDTRKLRIAFDRAGREQVKVRGEAVRTLSLETWLLVRSGRWTSWEPSIAGTDVSNSAHTS